MLAQNARVPKLRPAGPAGRRKSPRRVLLAHECAIVRQGIKFALAHSPGVIVAGEAADNQDLLAQARRGQWNIVVVSVDVLGIRGPELIDELKRLQPNVPVVVLCLDSENAHEFAALANRASAFLCRHCRAEELRDAVKRVLAGGRYVCERVAERLLDLKTPAGPAPLHTGLSNRQRQLLRMIAVGKKTTEMAQELGISPKTVSTHRTRLLEKMQMRSVAELVSYAVREGLI